MVPRAGALFLEFSSNNSFHLPTPIMPPARKRSYTDAAMDAAIAEVSGGATIKEASDKHGVPQSTLRSRVKAHKVSGPEVRVAADSGRRFAVHTKRG